MYRTKPYLLSSELFLGVSFAAIEINDPHTLLAVDDKPHHEAGRREVVRIR